MPSARLLLAAAAASLILAVHLFHAALATAPFRRAVADRRPAPASERRAPANAAPSHGLPPLAFEENRGQAPEAAAFVARTPGATVLVQDDAVVLAIAGGGARPVGLLLPGAAPASPWTAERPLPGVVHHYRGRDPASWLTSVPTFARVVRRGVHPGVDLVLRGDARRLEYDFLVAPGASPESIAVAFDGAERVRIEDGALLLESGAATLRHEAPFAYQEVGGARRGVACAWRARGDGSFGFEVGAYDRASALVIDPVVVHAGFLGGLGADAAEDVALDSAGRVHVVGTTSSPQFPLRAAEQGALLGVRDAFVTKLSADGGTVLWSTYLGGALNPGGDPETVGRALALDPAGSVFLTGWTASLDFPTTSLAFQRDAPGTRRDPQGVVIGTNFDAFAAKLSDEGRLLWATYLGGTGASPAEVNGDDLGTGIAPDPAGGGVFVMGQTLSTRFPTTLDAVQPLDPDAFRTGGAIFQNANDVFLARLSANGAALEYGTYLGGSLDDGGPLGRLPGGSGGLDVDAFGNVYLAGRTESGDFPVTPGAAQTLKRGAYDAFAVRLGRFAGSASVTYALTYATYLGGIADEGSRPASEFGVTVVSDGRFWVCGDTRSMDFPVTQDALQPAHAGGPADVDGFVARLDARVAGTASLEYATYLGGSLEDTATAVAAGAAGTPHVAGRTRSADFPVVDSIQGLPGGGEDAFVLKLSPVGTSLVFSTLFGGRGDEGARGLDVLLTGDVAIAGETSSLDLPSGGSALQRVYGGGSTDAFVLRLADGTPLLARDLAVLGVSAPRRVRLNASRPSRTVAVGVRIQNRGTRPETIADMETLASVVRLTVESMGACPAPAPVLRARGQARRLPLVLAPRQRALVVFDVTFDCANDAARSKRRDPGHDDFTYRAEVRRDAIDGAPDDHPLDDACPRPPMNVRDPFPDGTLRVAGCPAAVTDIEDRR